MANVPETPSYDAGVYQLEVTDPVQGGLSGVSNAQAKALADRTAYLKAHVDAIESGSFSLPGYAPINSPVFTGSPSGPTQPVGDSSTKLATDAFVAAATDGILSKSVAGGANVTLVATEYGYAILVLTGILTANINVIFPVNGVWVVQNSTSGAFSLTCKTVAGTGVIVPQGAGSSMVLYGDGVNINSALNIAGTLQRANNLADVANAATALGNLGGAPLASPVFTGTPQAPTATTGTNTTQLATTAFVQAQLISSLTSYAPINSPTFTGTPSAPTPAAADNTTKVATTAFVQTALGSISLTGYAQLGAAQAWTKGQRGAPVALVDAITVAVDLSAANNFSLLTTSGVGATRQLGAPTNASPGQSGIIEVTQDTAGSRALTYASVWKFSGGIAPPLSTAANAIDLLTYYVIDSTHILIGLAAKGVA